MMDDLTVCILGACVDADVTLTDEQMEQAREWSRQESAANNGVVSHWDTVFKVREIATGSGGACPTTWEQRSLINREFKEWCDGHCAAYTVANFLAYLNMPDGEKALKMVKGER